MATRKRLIAAVGQRYREASESARSKILDEFAELAKYHGKHAIRVLTRGRGEPCLSLARNRLHDEAVRQALIVLWEAGDRPSGKRLKALIPVLGACIADTYSFAAAGVIALRCSESRLYRVMAERLIVELLDEQGEACVPGQVHRAVVTDLHNFVRGLA